MPYRLKIDEPLDSGVKRIAIEQNARAVTELTSGEIDCGEAVHQARKRFKKIRGLLRLVRPSLGSTYQSENARYRDLGRKLSSARDADAVIEAFDALTSHFEEQMGSGLAVRVREQLLAQRAQSRSSADEMDERVQHVVQELQRAKQQVDSWPIAADGFSTIGAGLAKTYRRGRSAMQGAYEQPATEQFHEWRKRVKYHWYHVRLLRELWPEVMQSLRGELKKLSSLLGDDHDLAVLAEAVVPDADPLTLNPPEQALLGLISQRRKQLQAEAGPLGRRVYAEKPKQLYSRVGEYWAALAVEADALD